MSLGNKAINDTTVIKDTLNVTVKATAVVSYDETDTIVVKYVADSKLVN
ncbi:hypothetical protein [Clostridium estertheticum]|nr:hypothetical protein [Clostridium estertheticum]MBX4261011.1 hypothetical protein [Clostridium estertheticum]